MWARLSLNTVYSSLNDKEVREAVRDENNLLARVEYVQRYFKQDKVIWFFAPFATKEEVIKICDSSLALSPEHNFFNYARAHLEDDTEKKKQYLIQATKNCVHCGRAISAQAAYELSRMFYFSSNTDPIAWVAWLSKAILLGSEDACFDFVKNNLWGSEKAVHLRVFSYVFLTAFLSNKKIPGLTQAHLNRFDNADQILIIQAHQCLNHAGVLFEPDSPVRKMAEQILAARGDVAQTRATKFIEYFTYCLENNIISYDIFLSVMQFYFQSNYTEQNRLTQLAIDTVNKRNPTYLAPLLAPQAVPVYMTNTGYQYTQPVYQAPSNVYYTLPTAPPIDTTAYTGSYFNMYTQAPGMMPTVTNPLYATQEPAFVATQQSTTSGIVPVYIAPSHAPTPANSPVNTAIPDKLTNVQSDVRPFTFGRY